MMVEPVGLRDRHLSATSAFRYTLDSGQFVPSLKRHIRSQRHQNGDLRVDDHIVQGADSLSSMSERMASINAPLSVGCIEVGGATPV